MLSNVTRELQELNSNLRFLIKVLNEKLPGPVVEEYPPIPASDGDFPLRQFSSKKNIPDAMPIRGPKP